MCTASPSRKVPASCLDNILIGTAGWAIPLDLRDQFPAAGTLLERYGQVFNAVEINSSFHCSHRRKTYERWASSVPDAFRFSVKMPKQITHQLRLREVDGPLDRFRSEIGGLGRKLGAILIQLPPSLAFDRQVATDFFCRARSIFDGLLATEPRHSSWFTTQAAEAFSNLKIERVVADPSPCPGASFWDHAPKARYVRLHGAPRTYYSDYSEEVLAALARILTASRSDKPSWCIFDNTAAGKATANALSLRRALPISKSRQGNR